MPTSSSTDSTPSPNPTSNVLISTSRSFTPCPGMSATPGTTGSSVVSNSSSVQLITANSSPSLLRPTVTFPVAPPSLTSVPMPPPQNVQQQIYSPYPSVPAIAPTPQDPWLHPPLAGGLQHTPFLPYPGVYPASFPLPMRCTSVPLVPSPNVQPPGVSTAVPLSLIHI